MSQALSRCFVYSNSFNPHNTPRSQDHYHLHLLHQRTDTDQVTSLCSTADKCERCDGLVFQVCNQEKNQEGNQHV